MTLRPPTVTMQFMLDLPDLVSQTETEKVEQVKAFFSAVKNLHKPLHEAIKDTNVTEQVLDGSSRRLNTANTPADRAQVNQAVGKVTKPILPSL